MLSFKPEDAAQMRKVERALIDVMLPFKMNTEAALMVFALLRCARVLLRCYPPATQKQLLPVITAYLEGKTSEPGDTSVLLLD